MAEENSSELIQFVTTAVALLCAATSMTVYHKSPKWRKRNYLYAKQLLLKCAATCCTLSLVLLPDDMIETCIVIFVSIVVGTVLGTLHALALGHVRVALTCHDLPDEESAVATSWYYMTAVTCGTLYVVMHILKLDLVNIECIGAILLFAISTGNAMLLSRLFRVVRKCNINVTLMFSVNTLGIMCDVLLIVYAGLLLIFDDTSGLIYDVVIVTFTGTMFVQTILILFSKDAMDWKKCLPPGDELIEM